MGALKLRENLNKEENKELQKEFTKRFAARIKEIRATKGLSQTEVAERAGLHESYYGHIELRRFRPSLYVAWKVSKALGASLDELTNS